MKTFQKIKKPAAIFLSIALILSNNAGYAAPGVGNRESGIRDRESSAPVISIPEEFGKVEEVFQSPNPDPRFPKTVIYIQDAHDSLEAQENIAKIIGHLVEKNGVKTVFEEGFEGPVPTEDYFGTIQDPKIKERVSYYLLDKLRIGGAEYAHINRNYAKGRGHSAKGREHRAEGIGHRAESTRLEAERKPSALSPMPSAEFQLIGADDIKLHLENTEWYRRNAAHREETKKDLAILQKEIAGLAGRHFPKELKEWMKLKERFEKNEIGLLDYVKRVISIGERAKGIGQRAEGEGERAEGRGQRAEGKGQRAEGKEQREKKRSPLPYAAIHLLLAAENSHDEALLEKVKSIDAKTLFEEIERLEESVIAAPRDKTVRQILHYWKILRLFARLNEIQLTASEYQAVKGPLQKFKTRKLARFIVRHTGTSIVLSRQWEKNIRNAVRFYETACARDRAIEKTLEEYFKENPKSENLNKKQIQNNNFEKEKKASVLEHSNLNIVSDLGFRNLDSESSAILVFGGFHKDPIRHFLRKNGISYVIVTPKISAEDPVHRTYYRDLMVRDYSHLAIPPLVARATVNPHVYELGAQSPAAKSELRSQIQEITEAIERISQKKTSRTLLSRLVDEQLIKLPTRSETTRSEARSQNAAGLPEGISAELVTDREQYSALVDEAKRLKKESAQMPDGERAAGEFGDVARKLSFKKSSQRSFFWLRAVKDEQSGRVIGFRFTETNEPPTPGAEMIDSWGVSMARGASILRPDYHKKGIGLSLLKSDFEELQKAKVRLYVTEIEPANKASLRTVYKAANQMGLVMRGPVPGSETIYVVDLLPPSPGETGAASSGLESIPVFTPRSEGAVAEVAAHQKAS